jgi:outer membrane biosynthesis protein TonB
MELTRAEENKNRIISGTITVVIFALLLLFLLFFTIITPNPPFPEGGGGGGQELALGMMNVGNDDIDYSKMGKVTDVVAKQPEAKEEILTDENGEEVPIDKEPIKKDEPKPEVKNNTTVITPVKPREKTEAEKLAEKFKKNTGKTGGGIGNNAEAGQNGSPDGSPDFKGTGGHGTGDGGGEGEGKGPGSGPGFGGGRGGGIGIDLKGRAVVVPPKLPSDTKEEGKVVVEITVDKEGNVIEANPNGRGTTTSSALLKAKAKQAAMATKFNVNGKFEEQNGTITIIFSFD